MTKEKAFLGLPIQYKNFIIYPPLVKEIIGFDFLSIFRGLVLITAEEIEDIWIEEKKDLEQLPTPYEYLYVYYKGSEQIRNIIKEGFRLFLKTNIELLENSLLIGDIEDLKDIKKVQDLKIVFEEEYFDFQNILRTLLGMKEVEKPVLDENPRVKRIKRLARKREKIVAKVKGKGTTMANLFSAISCMNCGLNPLNVGEVTYASLLEILQTFQKKEKYELDIQSLFAGADSKKIKPEYWI